MSPISARWLVLLTLLALARSAAHSSRPLEVVPEAIPLAGGAVRVRLPPGAMNAMALDTQPSIGLSFGRLVRLPAALTNRHGRLRVCADVPALDILFDPPPRAGDELMLVVYAGTRPLSAARAVKVADAAIRGRCHSFPPPNPNRGDRLP